MDHLSFVFSLLLIVSLTATSSGSTIKAKNPANGEELELEELGSAPDQSMYSETAPNQKEIDALLSDAGLGHYPEMVPNQQELEALLERSNYSDPRMNSRDQNSDKTKRADPATVIAGITLGVSVLKDLLNTLGGVSRKIAIGIDNESGFTWRAPTHYFYSGTSDENLPYSLGNGKAVLYGARKTNGSVRGAVGVLAYYVPSIRRTVAIMYSVPFDYFWYENWWNLKLYRGRRRASRNMFKDLYYRANPFRANGWHDRDLGSDCKFRGVMSNSGKATLEIHVLTK